MKVDIDFKSCAIDELYDYINYIIKSPQKKYILNDILKRNDKKMKC